MDLTTTAALWWAVVLSGLYHGLNPGMGWPLAVSSALMERRESSLWRAMGALAGGHAVAMAAMLLPFAALIFLADWQREIQIVAASLVIGLGLYLLVNRRHPRFLARVPPGKLGLWSFLVALAHGAGLMLVPIYLGICAYDSLEGGHAAAGQLMAGNLKTAFLVAIAHTLAMTAAGAVLAFATYHWLGLQFLSKTWFNLDIVWALSLIGVGLFGIFAVH